MGASEAYVAGLAKHPRLAALAVVVLALAAAPFSLKLSSATADSFPASPGTPSEEEGNEFKAAFPSVFSDREAVYIKCTGSAADCACTAAMCQGFQGVVDALKSGLKKYSDDGTIVSLATVFDIFAEPALKPLEGSYYNETAQSMVVKLTLDVSKGDKAVKAAMAVAEQLVVDLSKPSEFVVDISGRQAGGDAAQKEIGKAIGMADGTGIFLIVILFGWRTRSWRLTMIPIVNTLCCLLLAEAICYPLALKAITVPTFVPNVCLFLCIALSVDYSFFHLSRFQELRQEGSEFMEAVEGMVTTAGRVVLVSGVVLLFTWLALCCLPVFGVDSLGYCASVTIGCCILVNMVMNPAIVLSFPTFFSNTSQDPCHCCRRRRAEAREPQAVQDVTNNVYGKMAKVVTRMPFMIIVPLVVYAVFLPAAVTLFTANLSVGGVQGGTDAKSRLAAEISQDFAGGGAASGAPLLVLLSAPHGQTVESEEYFSAGCTLARKLQVDAALPVDSIKGLMLGSAQESATELPCVTWSATKAFYATPFGKYMYEQAVNPDKTSSIITALPPYDTFSDEAKGLIASARKAVDDFNIEHEGPGSFTATAYHPMGIEVDAQAKVQTLFPIVISVTVLVVFTIIGIRYKAALVPIKLLFTIALPILFVLGSGVFVFQDGWLEWTHIPSLKKQGGLVWINPVACSFMLVGFALDYDLFLFSRIYEERKSGRFLNDRDAIVHSVAATGPVITTAGIIMALAFSGMVVQSANPFLCQMGFTMILGVLVDTFVVRTLLVPALLQAAGSANWWPGKMPAEEKRGQRQVFLDTSSP